ncbi:conserved hypothetical protein [Bacillus sp. IT-79MI2]
MISIYYPSFYIYIAISTYTLLLRKQKVTYTHFLSLFSLGMGQEKDLTASTLGRMLSITLKRVYIGSSIYIPPFT